MGYLIRKPCREQAMTVIREWRWYAPSDVLHAVFLREAAENRMEFSHRPPDFRPERLLRPRSAIRSCVGRVVVARRPEAGVVFVGGRR